MEKHKKHGAHPHDKMAAMPQFNEGHWTKDMGDTMSANEKYTSGEMSNPEHMKKSVDALASYAKKHRAQH